MAGMLNLLFMSIKSKSTSGSTSAASLSLTHLLIRYETSQGKEEEDDITNTIHKRDREYEYIAVCIASLPSLGSLHGGRRRHIFVW